MARRVATTGIVLVAFVVTGFIVNGGIRLACREGCGADIGRLYEDRGIDRTHPPYFSRDVEYPPVIGLVMWAAAIPVAHGLRWKFAFNALVLTSLAALTTWMLWRRYGNRTRRWALAPPLILQGLTNWDLLAVAPATIGLLQWESGSAFVAGLLVGIGAAAKLAPTLYVPILVASCAPQRAWRRARDVCMGAVVGAGAFVVPVYALTPSSLRFFLHFHTTRTPIRDSLWYYFFRTPAMHLWLARPVLVVTMNTITAVAVVASVVAIAAATARGHLTPVAACGLATIAFIVSNKIYSPQYDLWIVPFLVMVPVRGRVIAHFYLSSTLVWLLTATENHVLLHRPLSLYVLLAAVCYRLVTLGRISADLIRSRPGRDREIDVTSRRPTSGRTRRRPQEAPAVP
jgi:hypothetical protein